MTLFHLLSRIARPYGTRNRLLCQQPLDQTASTLYTQEAQQHPAIDIPQPVIF